MSIYEQRLDADKKEIRDRIAEVGRRVEQAMVDAVHALLTRDEPQAYATMLGDLPINREVRAIDKLCHGFVARHLPSAGHLRFISSVLRMNIALERVGDYAVTICRESVHLKSPPPPDLEGHIRGLADEAITYLRQAVRA